MKTFRSGIFLYNGEFTVHRHNHLTFILRTFFSTHQIASFFFNALLKRKIDRNLRIKVCGEIVVLNKSCVIPVWRNKQEGEIPVSVFVWLRIPNVSHTVVVMATSSILASRCQNIRVFFQIRYLNIQAGNGCRNIFTWNIKQQKKTNSAW